MQFLLLWEDQKIILFDYIIVKPNHHLKNAHEQHKNQYLERHFQWILQNWISFVDLYLENLVNLLKVFFSSNEIILSKYNKC